MKKAFVLVLALVVGAYLLSLGTVRVGDHFLTQDKIAQAGQLYKFSQLINPFLAADLEKRFLATTIITTERTTQSEETSFDQKTNNIASLESNVLGVQVTIPVLMYHYIRVNPDPNDRVGFNLSVTPANFAAQMEYLATHGYNPVSLDDLETALIHDGTLPQKPIIITFDDSYRDCFLQAFPILQKYHFKAINFVITGLVGAPNYLTWDQIREMKNSGLFTIASHTVHHLALTYVSDANIQKELTDSKNVLEKETRGPIYWFAYPYGNVDARVSTWVEKTGYTGAFGTNDGTFQSSSQIFTLPRVRVGGGDSLNSFAAKLPWN